MKKKIFIGIFIVFSCFSLFSYENEISDSVVEGSVVLADKTEEINIMWLFLCTVLVFFMQAGFSMLELGLSRSKNAGNIIMKNLMDFCIGSLVFFFIGYGIMFGTSVFGLFGKSKFFLMGSDPSEMSFWMFQVVFAATASTIVSGGVAERTKFVGYLIYSVVITGFIYPVIGHWIWGGGWLSRLGFYDFAGSGVVHLVGGLAALAGAVMIGPRKGKYTRVGDKIVVKAILGHNLPLASLGVFILWFGWFGFNCGSTLDFASSSISRVMLTTTLAGAAGAIIAMVITWVVSKKPDPSMSLNGALAGLVAITAGADVISPVMAIVVGLIGGALVVGSVELIDKVLHIDDPVGAVSVHGVNGLWGVVAVGLFSSDPDKLGLFYGGGFATLGIQLLGVVVILGWTLSTAFLLFFILKKASCLRVTEKEEMLGLDISEHGCESYSGFQIFTNM